MKKLLAMMLTVVLVLSMCACGAKEKATEVETVRVGTINAGVMTVANLYANEKGYFEKAGIETEIIPFNTGSEMFEAIPSGEWDICLIGASITTAISGYDIKIIGQVNWDDYAVECYVREDSEIAQTGTGHIEGYPDIYGTPEQWKGKTIITPVASTAHNMVVRTLEAMGLSERDVNIVGMDIATGLTAFKSGEGDMLAVWFPSSFAAREDGYVAASSCYAVDMHLPFYVACRAEFLEERPDLVQKYMEVTLKALAESEENAEEASDYYYDFCVEAGSNMEYEDVLDFVTTKAETNPSYQLDQQLEKFTVDANGSSAAIEELNKVFDFYIAQGRFVESDKDKTASSIDPSILQAIKDAQ